MVLLNSKQPSGRGASTIVIRKSEFVERCILGFSKAENLLVWLLCTFGIQSGNHEKRLFFRATGGKANPKRLRLLGRKKLNRKNRKDARKTEKMQNNIEKFEK